MAQAQARVLATKAAPARKAGTPTYASVLKAARALNGCLVKDARGTPLTDFRNQDGEVLLGWADPRVEAAVAASIGGRRLHEFEAAERLGSLLPCVEAVGFRASLEAALADALIAAQALTGRDGAFFCDDDTTLAGDLDSLDDVLDRHLGEVAAVVIRPMDAPRDFLLGARRLCDRDGIVLVFDESRTAFRVDIGGAQTLAGVLPDAAVLGPSLANGRAIGALAGRVEVLTALEHHGEAPSDAALAAACATLDRVEREDVPHALRVRGAEIEAEIETRLRATGADALLAIEGDPTWSLVHARRKPGIDPRRVEEALAGLLYEQGVLAYGAHVPSFATRDDAVARLLCAYDAALPELMAQALDGCFARRRRGVPA
jgi:glutamate-1-semialdehyde 2,1-aminomutase